HAEKEAVADDADEALRKDPPLSQAGQLRALGLTEDLPLKDLDAIYVTETKRSEDTAAAVVAITGIEPTHYPPKDVDGLVARLRRKAGSVSLVVGHSNTIPPLLQGLGVKEAVTIDESAYGDLWVVQAKSDGTATLERRRFGESIERFDPGK
ncbi:MAG: histidine phosphatase family protein, partial [Myxococcales bacterium]|nr:histidine phosphatase family protein [Myxococcales bacterium]